MLSKNTLDQLRYISVHAHSGLSLQDGVGTIKDHLKETIHKGHQGMCLTDHGVMSGCLQLYRLSRDKGLLTELNRQSNVPIIMGSELYITQNLDRNPENKYNHITVVAKNNIGYKNLCYLTSIGSLDDHFYSRPRISLQELIDHKEGLIVTTGCFIGMIPQAIVKKTGEEDRLTELFKKEFGDDFYIELHVSDIRMKWNSDLRKHVDQGFNPQEEVNIRLIELAKKYDVQVVIAQDSHMPKKEHHAVQTIMIQNSPGGKSGWFFHDPYYIMSVAEMYEKTQQVCPYISDDDFVKYCENSMKILDSCKNLKLEFEPLLPEINYAEHPVNQNPKNETKLNFLQENFEQLDPDFANILEISKNDIALRTAIKVIIKNKKVDVLNDAYRKQLVKELLTVQRNGVIKLMNYFMFMEDVNSFIGDNGFYRGLGRGSGCGCLLAYGLDITDVDPIRWNLLFERFLTKERIGDMTFTIPEFPIKK